MTRYGKRSTPKPKSRIPLADDGADRGVDHRHQAGPLFVLLGDVGPRRGDEEEVGEWEFLGGGSVR